MEAAASLLCQLLLAIQAPGLRLPAGAAGARQLKPEKRAGRRREERDSGGEDADKAVRGPESEGGWGEAL